jgi:hypothetical protein
LVPRLQESKRAIFIERVCREPQNRKAMASWLRYRTRDLSTVKGDQVSLLTFASRNKGWLFLLLQVTCFSLHNCIPFKGEKSIELTT